MSTLQLTSRPAPAVRAIRPGRQPASPRLTRRGRLVVVLVLTVALFALASVGRVWAFATADASSGPVTSTWVVQPGETLWDVASAVDPGADPRDTIARIVDLNDLPTSSVTVGQSIQVPVH